MKFLPLMFLGLATCHADNVVTLAWDPVADATSYRLYYGLNTNSVVNSVDVGTNTLVAFSFPPVLKLSFAVTASNEFGESVLGTVISTNLPQFVPKIAHQPVDVTNRVGQITSFAVQVSNNTPIGYQWKFQGTNVASATNAFYSFPITNRSLAGLYSVTISNPIGTVISAKAKLTIP